MKTLMIIPSETRGLDSIYKSLQKHVLNLSNSIDVGLFVSEESDISLIPNYTYHYTLPEYKDHRQGLIHELNCLGIDIPEILTDNKSLNNYQTSTIIHIYYRLFILRMLRKHKLINRYDFFMINRSDLMHTQDIDVSALNHNKVYLPNGEHWGGLPDRFAIIPKKHVEHWLNIYDEMFFKDSSQMYGSPLPQGGHRGPEYMTKHNKEKHNISIKYIPYTFYCVRNPEDKTRWSSGVYVESIRLFVKYPTEYQLVIKNHSLY
uniref:Uncharacterized protein n=1 Tax=Megaviridae environmental sample TaxID=1737588 RepID=A0A5J6VMD2_9VIRU|nr:MAG: hypothetical protein [Megaviridae environmental sample]